MELNNGPLEVKPKQQTRRLGEYFARGFWAVCTFLPSTSLHSAPSRFPSPLQAASPLPSPAPSQIPRPLPAPSSPTATSTPAGRMGGSFGACFGRDAERDPGRFPLRMPGACSVPDGGAARSSLGVILFGGEVLPSATIIAIHRVCPNGTPNTRPGPKSTPKMEMGNGTLIPHPNLCHQNSSNLVGTTESKFRQSPKIPNIKIRNHEQLTTVCVAFFGGHSMVRLAFCSSTDSVPFSGTTLFVASSSSMGGLTKPRT